MWPKARLDLRDNRLQRGAEFIVGIRVSPFLEASGGARVFCHSQVIEDQANIACELSHFLCNATHALGFDDSDGKTSEARDVFRAIAGAYATAVFIEIPVQDVVAAVFNAPVAAVNGKELLRA